MVNFDLTKGKKSIIQCREHHDLGQTCVLVVEWADGDMGRYRNAPFKNITTDRAFRVLARQLIEGVATLDKLGLYHDNLGVYDFLYVCKEGRVKLSALERAVKSEPPNSEALKVVYDALVTVTHSRKINLSDTSSNLLSILKCGKTIAVELLKHKAFTSLTGDFYLDL